MVASGTGTGLPATQGTGEDRLASIDALRGAAILLMAVGNFAMGVRWVPSSLKHAPDIGFTIADLVAPIFVVSIGLTAGPSMRRRRALRGTQAALVHMVKRALALIGIGSVISIGQRILKPQAGLDLTWGVLQSLGCATLLLLPFVFLPTGVRLLVGLALLGGYQVLLEHFWLAAVLRSSHNGIWGSLSWGGLLLLATAVSDGFWAAPTWSRRVAWLAACGGAASASAALLAAWEPISKHRASAPYMLLSLGLCLLLLAIFHAVPERQLRGVPWLLAVGRNPLLLYLANLLLLAVFTLPSADAWHAGADPVLTLAEAAAILMANLGLARELDRRGWLLRL